MATENFKKAGEIFENAIEIEDPAKREDYLENACKADRTLRAEVEALLEAHEKAGDFLEVPAVDSNVTLDGPAQIEGPGTRIGRYELLELIGEGGMGLVYLAEQKEPVKRRVALKIIKLGMDTKQVIARFEAERQVLAMMDHPNVAKVLDAGATDAGRPYFVMELVKGVSITEYCDKSKLSTRQRLDLFIQVCNAVEHAHQKGIIHRDLKPGNVLVTPANDVKILDFGIAARLDSGDGDSAAMCGTPFYMAPEQIRGETPTPATDIYSFGATAFHLATGRPPFHTGVVIDAHLNAAPPDPLKLAPDLDPELAQIILRCLEKSPADRFTTTRELCAALERLRT